MRDLSARTRVGIARALAACLLLLNAPASAEPAESDLYVGRTIVTGQGPESRARGIATCFEDVLAKVSGDPRLLDDLQVDALAGAAAEHVVKFGYRDLMAGIPVHDEQGTRDRPYELTVRFQPDAIDAALRSLGRSPWPEPRPRIVMVVRVTNGAVSYVLAGDGERGRDMRDALAAAAQRFGVPTVLPGSAMLAGLGPSASEIEQLEELAASAGGEITLAGSLVWNDAALGWAADWRLQHAGKVHEWNIEGVSFDAAFRNAIVGAAQILSGNGEP
jgi:hypothetical protein